MLDNLSVEPSRLRAWGPQAALEVSCPAPGVLRVRHSPASRETNFSHPELPPKRSYAVVHEGALPLTVERSEKGAVATAEGASLALSLDGRSWTFRDSTGRALAECVRVAGHVTHGYPAPLYESSLALRARPGEAFLGFGEKVGPLDKRGMRLTFWNTDVLPHHPDTDPLYASIPFFVGLADGTAWGLFLDEPWRSEVDVALADPSLVQWESSGPELDVYLIVGPHPADVLERYTTLTGRPPMPPLWSLGAHQSRYGYESTEDIRSIVRAYRAHDLPLDCIHLDIDYMEGFKVWTWDHARYPEPRALASEAGAEGVKLVTIVDPGVKAEPGYRPYDEAKQQNLLVRHDRGDVLVGEAWPDPAVFPDFTREEVRQWWSGLHRDFIEGGIAGFWTDMNEPSCFRFQQPAHLLNPTEIPPGLSGRVEGPTLPYNARHGSKRHIEVHNVYGLGMARASFEAMRKFAPERRPFVLTRSGYAGVQRYAAMWTGDNSSHWSHLEMSIPMLLGLGMSGVAFTGTDIPGFLGRPSGELLIRWMQAGTFYPLMRNHSAKGTPPKEPWRFGEPYLTLARAALQRRYRLLPTLYTLMHEATNRGVPPLRPLVILAPSEPDAVNASDQFLFGAELLVAPIVRAGQTKRLAYLPAGRWLELFNLEAGGSTVEGGQHVIVEAPLARVPIWLREGGAVALTAPAPHTESANWKAIDWYVHPGKEIRGQLYEDAGDGEGESRTTLVSGTFDGQLLVLERRATGKLPLARRSETLWIHGVSDAKSVTGALQHHFESGRLEVQVPADWTRVEVRFAGVVR